MEFSVAEIIAIAAVILNVIVYLARVPTKSEMNQRFAELRTELKSDISDLRREISTLNKSFTDHLMIMHQNTNTEK